MIEDPREFLALNTALERLQTLHPAKAELVKLRFFAGVTLEEAGKLLGISEPTAKRHWAFARAWLFKETRREAAR
jgi:RNA polymerase sigma factor (sigma-70 family)